jgi:hypothetical protein
MRNFFALPAVQPSSTGAGWSRTNLRFARDNTNLLVGLIWTDVSQGVVTSRPGRHTRTGLPQQEALPQVPAATRIGPRTSFAPTKQGALVLPIGSLGGSKL